MRIPDPHLATNIESNLYSNELQGFDLHDVKKELPIIEIPANPGDTIDLLKKLNVERSPRYAKKPGGITYCNIYAKDYAQQHKDKNGKRIYIPGVWWTDEILKIQNYTQIVYKKTVRELDANQLYVWFEKYSNGFGWNQISNVQTLYDLANRGAVCVITGKNRLSGKAGHITVAIREFPEIGQFAKYDKDGKVLIPLQSEAGGKNQMFSLSDWFLWPEFKGQVKFYAHNGENR